MLTAACDAPPVGERVELVEMLTTDRMVRDGATNLPRFARVLRHDDMEGLTRRIAVRFEADADEPRTTLKQRVATATMKRSCVAPIPPPSPTADGIGRLAGINATPP